LPPRGTSVSDYTGQPGPPTSRSRRALSTGLSIFLLAAGAVFWLALPPGRHLGINLHVVGIIVLCAGVLGLVLRRLPGLSVTTDLLSRWVIPRGTKGPGEALAGDDRYDEGDDQPVIGNRGADAGPPTVADDLLHAEQHPPL
jgi:hypothetical protein